MIDAIESLAERVHHHAFTESETLDLHSNCENNGSKYDDAEHLTPKVFPNVRLRQRVGVLNSVTDI